MKRNLLIISAVIFTMFVVCLPSASAIPISGSNDNYDYIMGASDFSKLSIGIYSRERTVKVRLEPGYTDYEMTMNKMTGYLGYDVLRWATVYLVGGSTDTRLNNDRYNFHQEYNGGEGETGIGVVLNLIDHDIADPQMMEDRIRVNAGLEYTRSKMVWRHASQGVRNANIEWEEIFASLTFSFVNEIDGNKIFWPTGIALFGGPVYSHIESSSMENNGKVGFTAGATLIYSEKLSIECAVEKIEEDGFSMGANFKF